MLSAVLVNWLLFIYFSCHRLTPFTTATLLCGYLSYFGGKFHVALLKWIVWVRKRCVYILGWQRKPWEWTVGLLREWQKCSETFGHIGRLPEGRIFTSMCQSNARGVMEKDRHPCYGRIKWSNISDMVGSLHTWKFVVLGKLVRWNLNYVYSAIHRFHWGKYGTTVRTNRWKQC